MMRTPINVATRSKDYQTPAPIAGKEKEPPPSSSTLSSSPLQIECPNLDSATQPPSRGELQKSSYNPNARAIQHYNIVEDLAQAPSAMSALKVLQSCPSQWKSLLSAIGGIGPTDSNLIYFDLENHVSRLPHQISFLIQAIINENTIHHTFIDEGPSTCIMSRACWKAIGSPALNQSPNTLEALFGHDLQPFGVLSNLAITLKVRECKLK